MDKILLIGTNGQLGWELNRCLGTLGNLVAVDYPEIDLTAPNELRKLVRGLAPSIIVNAAAFTAVDRAETDKETAGAVNAEAPGLLAEEARRLDALFVHYSTDYVFDGKKGSPYTEADAPSPLNFYGYSKWEGEKLVLSSGAFAMVLRTSWVYSLRQSGGFVQKVLQWARQNPNLRIVEDQVGNPTWARLLAEITAQVLSRGRENLRGFDGLYHLAGSGFTSRLECARMILELDPHKFEQVARQIQPALTADFPSPAVRPLFSALDCSRFEEVFGLALPPWQDALRLAMS